MDVFSKEKRGQFIVDQRKKKREIIEESGRRVELPPDVGESPARKRALEQTGDDNIYG